VPPDLIDERRKLGDQGIEFGKIAGERVFGADRLPDPVGPDLAIVDASKAWLEATEAWQAIRATITILVDLPLSSFCNTEKSAVPVMPQVVPADGRRNGVRF
jgi:hypothetical protein